MARFASEWNAVFATQAQLVSLNARLDQLLTEAGRQPNEVRRSMMTGCIFGKDDAALQSKLSERGRTAAELRERGLVAGTGPEVVEQLGKLTEIGLQRVMLQWLDLNDMDGLESLAKAVLG